MPRVPARSSALATSAAAPRAYSPVRQVSWDQVDKKKFNSLGPLAFGLVKTVIYPADVVKTRMQTGSRLGLMTAAGAVLADAPGRGLFRLSVFLKGLPPTAVGYFLQAITDERVGERTG